MDFQTRYSKLNPAQKEAVDCIDGPVMVIAGPGTGKTELLSVRAANILHKTDTLPENILCLTFTDSGANAMRERLTEIIGKDAYKFAIHTFHSFGSEIINQNGQYFYQGASFRPADELDSYEIIQGILKELDYNNPLSSKLNGEYTHRTDILTSISELKRSGLTSDELLSLLDRNQAVIEKVEQLISPVFEDRINKTTAFSLAKHIDPIRNSDHIISSELVSLSTVFADSLETAITEANNSGSTKPITNWRNEWFKKNEKGKFILKSRDRQVKLRALSFIYEQYLRRMQEAALYDFDDMILRVVHAMEVFDDLRFNLQEKYQYIMVDEFQDTNMAQMRILHNLTNNLAHGDTPNILVVGDDDQAIYSFQGAEVSNILNFRHNYPKSGLITLTENYRSNADILKGARDIITQGNERLENIIDELNKELVAKNSQNGTWVTLREATAITDERSFIVKDIEAKIASGIKPAEIAVLTRRHWEINALLPYFAKVGIAVNYERRDNVLDVEPVKFIESLSKLLIDLSQGKHDEVNSRLPEMLSHPAWGIEPIDLWKLSSRAYDNHKRWLDIMAVTPRFLKLHEWLISTSSLIYDTPLEQMLDIMIGKNEPEDESQFKSPFYEYYFSEYQMENNSTNYLTYLEALRTIRARLCDYHPDHIPNLVTFTDFIDLSRRIGSTISTIRPAAHSEGAINIMTTHKSKGLEFAVVYIANAVDNIWGTRARSRSRLITYPENLPIAPVGETDDERLRLFYVAATRAKNELNISYSLSDDSGKNTMLASFLVDSIWKHERIATPSEENRELESVELAWYHPLVQTSASLKDLLLPMLENYKLSVTHLQNFLDVTRGGPAMFLLNNLLHFPQSKSANAAYGTAIHDTLQAAHSRIYSQTGVQAIEDIISNFEQNLKNQHLPEKDFKDYLQKGSDDLRAFLDLKYCTFSTTQRTELDFSNQLCRVDTAHITGKLDLVDIDPKKETIAIVDYKTGKPSLNWNGKSDYEKIKLHKYRQQLLFYKLLVDSSRDYHQHTVTSGTIQFIEPTRLGEVMSLDINFEQGELEQFAKLIDAVWKCITCLNLPDVSRYEQSIKGILEFENDLTNSAQN